MYHLKGKYKKIFHVCTLYLYIRRALCMCVCICALFSRKYFILTTVQKKPLLRVMNVLCPVYIL